VLAVVLERPGSFKKVNNYSLLPFQRFGTSSAKRVEEHFRMAKFEPNSYGQVGISWAALKSLDVDKTPMPHQGMKAIAAICREGSASMAALASARFGGLGGLVGGSPAPLMMAAPRVQEANGALLAGLVGLGAYAALSKGGVSEASISGTPGPAVSSETSDTSKTGTEAKKEETKTETPSAAKPDPKKYSGFEEPEMGKGTKVTLGMTDPMKPVTITLSDGAAGRMEAVPDNVPVVGGKIQPMPKTINATPVKFGETQKPGFEMIEYGGQKYWVSKQDKATYAGWNKGLAKTGGLQPADATMEAVKAPPPPKVTAKPAVVAKPAANGSNLSGATSGTVVDALKWLKPQPGGDATTTAKPEEKKPEEKKTPPIAIDLLGATPKGTIVWNDGTPYEDPFKMPPPK
jgi:hypothetical protein